LGRAPGHTSSGTTLQDACVHALLKGLGVVRRMRRYIPPKEKIRGPR